MNHGILGISSAALAFLCAGGSLADDADIDLVASGALETTWRGYRRDASPEQWKLIDGVLTLDGQGGDLITREKFAEFDLRFEWKIAPGGNSGVMYLVSEDGDAPYFSGPEYQVIDTNYSETLDSRQSPGALYDLYPFDPEATKPAGEWNRSRILLKDGVVTHWLNGVEIVSAEVGSDDWNQRVAASKFQQWPLFGRNRSGHIALQDHDHPVWYRKMRIKRLDAE